MSVSTSWIISGIFPDLCEGEFGGGALDSEDCELAALYECRGRSISRFFDIIWLQDFGDDLLACRLIEVRELHYNRGEWRKVCAYGLLDV